MGVLWIDGCGGIGYVTWELVDAAEEAERVSAVGLLPPSGDGGVQLKLGFEIVDLESVRVGKKPAMGDG
jgi:hypothetical protein